MHCKSMAYHIGFFFFNCIMKGKEPARKSTQKDLPAEEESQDL